MTGARPAPSQTAATLDHHDATRLLLRIDGATYDLAGLADSEVSGVIADHLDTHGLPSVVRVGSRSVRIPRGGCSQSWLVDRVLSLLYPDGE